jgi:NADH-quinone oxidoreductase subunit L
MTHAFFKALLFLAAGIGIHALTGEQDIRRMAGLGRLLPRTRLVFLVGSLALVGIPPFAGFFSKDPIIATALNHGTYGVILAFACLVGALLTGIYAFRLYFIVFTGEPSAHAQEHLHLHHGREAPLSMAWTVGVLGVLSFAGGWIQFVPFWEPITKWLDPVAAPTVTATDRQELIASVCAVLFGLIGIGVAWAMYYRKTAEVPKAWPVLEKKFYFDEAYGLVFYKPAVAFSLALGRFVERPLIAGSIGEVTRGFGFGSRELGRVQNGLVRSYALALASGIAVLAVVFLWVR